ncbi:GNAT family N-acetyltransferase [bacterium]|nr:GNAT family N-acetyltransferase [bacterium]
MEPQILGRAVSRLETHTARPRRVVVPERPQQHLGRRCCGYADRSDGISRCQEKKIGEIEFLVEHPDYQNDGIGTRLNEFALTQMHAAGMVLVEVGTGGDDTHAPARRAYEKAGFIAVPLVRYFKRLD